ncbi:hypothetical protein AB8Q28_00540 [Klebsiella variicola]|uniref:hypothetical protein n=1 Tax=Klebsiella variicola TaxID=244366 RepID=UPI001304740F|nr:hypothetical protein [Klebsiella variicola]
MALDGLFVMLATPDAVKNATGYTLVKIHFARSLIPDGCAVEFSGFFGTSLILIFWIE